ncbi:MAG: antibiotic biosynthesis monooxygenase [Leptospirales bacterium]|nr:antibiotic biosynthesis monooxygenase [Leptospirales bacterium]
MVLELAILNVKPGQGNQFEANFKLASPLIASIKGYVTHSLNRCIEDPNKYALLVTWETLEDHTIGFRTSPQYAQWKELLHHFYDPFPVVEHFNGVNLT